MPEPIEPEIEHQPTADVILIVSYLLEHGGWARSSELARASGVHRDTARRILGQLAQSAWAERREVEGETRYRVGPELPRIGLAFLELLTREQAEILGRYNQAVIPHSWTPGAGGRMAWRPTEDPPPPSTPSMCREP